MKNGFCAVLCVAAAAGAACGGEGPGRQGTGTGIGSVGATEGDTDSGSATEGNSQGSNSHGSNSQGSNTEGDDETMGGQKFDVGLPPDGSLGCMENGGDGGGNGGAPDFSYIWIANSNEGTISKVNTQTLIEEGRYIVRPDAAGNPSRTSVNLNGDVAVANRAGGLTMIAARPEDCPNPNNTSTGPADVKAWPDGCVVWHTPFAYESQRPVAWSQGTFNTDTCRYEDMVVWTSTHNSGTTTADIFRVSGDDGVIEDQVTVNGVQTHVYGIYGAAADAGGNMWGSELGQGLLVNVDLATMALRTWNMPISGYGMTVDHVGNVWVCQSQVARFDPATQTWQQSGNLSSGGNGCMEDGNGTLWVAADGFVGVDINTLAEVGFLALPARVRGVSFDFEGYVWGPSIVSNEAYRVDPTNGATDTVTGFNYPYTYSDMTGFALSNAGDPDG